MTSVLFLCANALADPPSAQAPVSSSFKQGIQSIFQNQTPINPEAEAADNLFSLELGSLEYADEQGGVLDTETYKSKKVLVYFWSVYCRGCIEPVKELERVRSALRESGIEVVTVHLFESDRMRLVNRLAQMSLGLPVLFGANEIRDLFSVRVLPTAIAFDDKHRVIARVEGEFNSDSLSLKLTKRVETSVETSGK